MSNVKEVIILLAENERVFNYVKFVEINAASKDLN